MEIPKDMARYYPSTTYYSLNGSKTNVIKRLRDFVYMSPFSFLVNWHPRTDMDAMREAGLTRCKTLLDVGCGNGYLIFDLRKIGFNAIGCDPFVSENIRDWKGTAVYSRTLDQMVGDWDVILFRYSLEHMADHVETLRRAREHLKPGGMCIVCIPLVGWAWREYGVKWVQLDAPRHFLVHSRKSFDRTVALAGFTLRKITYDSDDFQFTGSTHPHPSAEELNRREEGDQARFYLSVA